MVLEQVFKARWLERRPRYAFLMAFIYSIVGIISAKLIFGANPSLMAVSFASILLIPSLNRLLSDEESIEIRENKFSIKALFKDHKDVFEVYFFLFMGTFAAFALVTLFVPSMSAEYLFSRQLAVGGFVGHAFSATFFKSLLLNNLKVLAVCLVLSFFYGAGAILFITWNASVWGVIFAYVAKSATQISGMNPFVAFAATIAPALPHLITEAAGYFTAAIVGGTVSKAVMRENWGSKSFHHVLTDALIFLALGVGFIILAALFEARLA
jgi:hypothetical protein